MSAQDGDLLPASPRPHPPLRRGGGPEPGGHGGPAQLQTQAAAAQGTDCLQCLQAD